MRVKMDRVVRGQPLQQQTEALMKTTWLDMVL